MTPAERLRAAAEKIRETSGAATGATHAWDNIPAGAGVSRVFCGQVLIAKTDERIGQQDHNAQHIALWSPPVALMAAKTLDQHAEEHSVNDCQWVNCDALALADLILGAES